MKKSLILCFLLSLLLLCSCNKSESTSNIVATTRPVYDFTVLLCDGTGIEVDLLVTEQLSCLHDYTLQVRQMRSLESAQLVVLSGAGLENFLDDALLNAENTIDASKNIDLLCAGHAHESTGSHDEHHHENDPHIWLDVANARMMAANICEGLVYHFPAHEDTFRKNLIALNQQFDTLDEYGKTQLSQLKSKELITFHDGFAYFAEYWGLHIIHSLEEESGSEASASELKSLIRLVQDHALPAIFVEENGSTSASGIIANETGVDIYTLNMGMSDKGYFESMYQNINQIKEALG